MTDNQLDYFCAIGRWDSGYGTLDECLWYDEEEAELITNIVEE